MRNLLFQFIIAWHFVRSIRIAGMINFPMMSFLLLLACHGETVNPNMTGNTNSGSSNTGGGNTGTNTPATFLTFSTNAQTLPASIKSSSNQVTLEVDHGTDMTKLIPQFTIPAGYTAYVKNISQVPGSTVVDFTTPVTYELRDASNVASAWTVSAIPLGCKVLIDASHDGGVWWYPQYEATGFNPSAPHQGKAFADLLRSKGLEVNELGRGKELTDEMFYGHYIVIRANGFETYTPAELQVYGRLIDRGMNLVFLTDHKKFDLADELGDLLGLKMVGLANGTVTTFAPHKITANMTSLPYIAGSVLATGNKNPNITILGWLGPSDYADLNFNGTKDPDEPLGSPVMGIVKYNKSQVFFIGDTNGVEVQSQPFINNLISWMGLCF